MLAIWWPGQSRKFSRMLAELCPNSLTKKSVIYWFAKKNWGDALNPILIKNISGIKPTNVYTYHYKIENEPIYAVIGSILNSIYSRNLIIWGAGFLQPTEKLHAKPRKICAIRGPLSRKKLIKQGLKCPKVYGDPALLYPKYYRPLLKKKYKIGIISHRSEQKNELLKKFQNNSDILIINISNRINKVVDDICRCEYIASSALHGIIAADAYGIPSIRIEFENNREWMKKNFKMQDYFASVGRKYKPPVLITEKTKISDIYDKFYDYDISIDLDKLFDACPFRK